MYSTTSEIDGTPFVDNTAQSTFTVSPNFLGTSVPFQSFLLFLFHSNSYTTTLPSPRYYEDVIQDLDEDLHSSSESWRFPEKVFHPTWKYATSGISVPLKKINSTTRSRKNDTPFSNIFLSSQMLERKMLQTDEQNPRTPYEQNPRTPYEQNPRTPYEQNPRTPYEQNPRTPYEQNPRTPYEQNPCTPYEQDSLQSNENASYLERLLTPRGDDMLLEFNSTFNVYFTLRRGPYALFNEDFAIPTFYRGNNPDLTKTNFRPGKKMYLGHTYALKDLRAQAMLDRSHVDFGRQFCLPADFQKVVNKRDFAFFYTEPVAQTLRDVNGVLQRGLKYLPKPVKHPLMKAQRLKYVEDFPRPQQNFLSHVVDATSSYHMDPIEVKKKKKLYEQSTDPNAFFFDFDYFPVDEAQKLCFDISIDTKYSQSRFTKRNPFVRGLKRKLRTGEPNLYEDHLKPSPFVTLPALVESPEDQAVLKESRARFYEKHYKIGMTRKDLVVGLTLNQDEKMVKIREQDKKALWGEFISLFGHPLRRVGNKTLKVADRKKTLPACFFLDDQKREKKGAFQPDDIPSFLPPATLPRPVSREKSEKYLRISMVSGMLHV